MTAKHLHAAIAGMEGKSSLRFVIHGHLWSMKNKRIPLKSNPFITITSPQCRQFEKDFAAQLVDSQKLGLGSLQEPLQATVTVYYPSMRQDLDCAFLYDLMQKYGVVANDRYIRRKIETARIDKVNPRVEIELRKVEL